MDYHSYAFHFESLGKEGIELFVSKSDGSQKIHHIFWSSDCSLRIDACMIYLVKWKLSKLHTSDKLDSLPLEFSSTPLKRRALTKEEVLEFRRRGVAVVLCQDCLCRKPRLLRHG